LLGIAEWKSRLFYERPVQRMVAACIVIFDVRVLDNLRSHATLMAEFALAFFLFVRW
jgi:hypothetical protein